MTLTRTPPARAIESLQAEPKLVRQAWEKKKRFPSVSCTVHQFLKFPDSVF